MAPQLNSSTYAKQLADVFETGPSVKTTYSTMHNLSRDKKFPDFYKPGNNFIPYMPLSKVGNDALMSRLRIHIQHRNQFIAARYTCHDIQAGFRHTQDIRKEFD